MKRNYGESLKRPKGSTTGSFKHHPFHPGTTIGVLETANFGETTKREFQTPPLSLVQSQVPAEIVSDAAAAAAHPSLGWEGRLKASISWVPASDARTLL